MDEEIQLLLIDDNGANSKWIDFEICVGSKIIAFGHTYRVDEIEPSRSGKTIIANRISK